MGLSVSDRSRVRVDGKFFRLGEKKFCAKGITYGPFAPITADPGFASPEQTARDLDLIQQLGATHLRVYYVPPGWFLDLLQQRQLKVLVDIPWSKHTCFMDDLASREAAMATVRAAAESCARHPAVFALSVVNEIPADVVRWSGARETAEFIEELVRVVKSVDPECLCTFGNYPPTEYLRPQNIDFVCFNVYLHHQKPFENYLGRLQMIADSKPLVLGEFGIDSLREGEEAQAEILRWQIETAFRGGLAGAVVYSFTDDWHKGGQQVEDWAFGLTKRNRDLKPAFETVRRLFRAAPYFPLPHHPMVSVVIASYNGERTLDTCLRSLQSLNYPAYEVILVDDGSTDRSADIAARYPAVRYIKHELNQGLSAARNTGLAAARGQIIAYTDSDCRADEDWLHYLVGDLLNSKYAGIGGHNLLPPEDSWVAVAVMLSPGGPAHVMLTDRLAEHIPGCNMAFYKWALEEIGGFDPIFRKAGDDVDVCWRLQQQGYQIGFSPAGFVWHYRRSTAREYLKQQRGYGEAEALLVHRHPEKFNWFGGSQWQGRIYSAASFGVVIRSPMIYHGWFGTGFFQTLYNSTPSFTLMLLTSFEYHLFVNIPLLILGVVFRPLIPTAVASLLVSVLVCCIAAAQADLPKERIRFWSRPLVAWLFLLQPIARGWARYQRSLRVPRSSLAHRENLESLSREDAGQSFDTLEFWDERGLDRIEFLGAIIERLDSRGWQNKADAGWNDFDIEIYGSAWSHLEVTTVAEAMAGGKQLIRCRLKPAWTLLAKVVLLAAFAFELLLIGLFGSAFWWLTLLLLSLPAMTFYLARQQRDLQRLIAVFLEEVAAEFRLIRHNAPASPSAPASENPIPRK